LIGWESQTGSSDSEHTQNFYTDWGVKMAIVDNGGHVRALGGSLWMVHRYDGKGNLLSRLPMRKSLQKGERVVYGHTKAYEAYHNQPGYVPESLQRGFEV
jgi:hypothetical protein